MADVVPVTQPSPDASKVLQDLLGLSALASQFKTAIVGAMTSPEVSTVFTTAFMTGWKQALSDGSFENAMFSLFTRICGDEKERIKLASLLSSVLASENAKGVVAEGVFAGFKRLVADVDAQANIVAIGGSLLSSQDTANVTNKILDGFSRRLRDYFASAEFAAAFKSNSTGALASLQELLNLSIKEGLEEVKGIKLTGTFTAG